MFPSTENLQLQVTDESPTPLSQYYIHYYFHDLSRNVVNPTWLLVYKTIKSATVHKKKKKHKIGEQFYDSKRNIIGIYNKRTF
jgi:hypothetical protein